MYYKNESYNNREGRRSSKSRGGKESNNIATQSSQYEYITGIIERITYHNEENGFAVLKVTIKKKRDLVTVTGNVPSVSVGEEIQAQGSWVNSIKHGLGFKAHYIRIIPPTSLEGL